ncbi:hypothetical protein MRX96_014727 [Rhipicephalus microplus]
MALSSRRQARSITASLRKQASLPVGGVTTRASDRAARRNTSNRTQLARRETPRHIVLAFGTAQGGKRGAYIATLGMFPRVAFSLPAPEGRGSVHSRQHQSALCAHRSPNHENNGALVWPRLLSQPSSSSFSPILRSKFFLRFYALRALRQQEVPFPPVSDVTSGTGRCGRSDGSGTEGVQAHSLNTATRQGNTAVAQQCKLCSKPLRSLSFSQSLADHI